MNIIPFLLNEHDFQAAYEALVVDHREHLARELTDCELSHWGFADEAPWQDGTGVHFDVIHTERVLPSEVVRLRCEQRYREWEAEHGEWPGKKVRTELRDQLLAKLIPNAPQRRSRLAVHLRPCLGMVLIDANKGTDAEAVLTLIRRELGSFPALPMGTLGNVGISLGLTEALIQHSELRNSGTIERFPLIVDDCATLERPGEKARVRFSHMDLACEEVRDCLRNGFRVARLGVADRDRLVEAEVDKELALRRFDVTDVDEDRLDDEMDRWGDNAMRVIRFGEAARLLLALAAWLKIEQPLAEEKKAA